MSCPDNNCSDPCLQSECQETNPCYDNCGCLNPTTFECVTKPGDFSGLGITNNMNGTQALSAINDVVSALSVTEGQVMFDSTDSCPGYLSDKIEAGTNIDFTFTGTGCERRLVISSTTGDTPIDVNVKVTSADTTTGYLNDKITVGSYLTKSVTSPAGNEKLRLNVVPSTLISADSGNLLTLGTDGALLAASPTVPNSYLVAGSGVTLTGTGDQSDPWIISINPSIQVARPCFDGVWHDLTLIATGNPDVIWNAGVPQYRYRFDGSIEFRGTATYTVNFGDYYSGDRKYTITLGAVPTTCVTLPEQAGSRELKSIMYIDAPQAGADQFVQQYGYIIKKFNQNIQVDFSSSFINDTSKTIVVTFDGVISHPAF